MILMFEYQLNIKIFIADQSNIPPTPRPSRLKWPLWALVCSPTLSLIVIKVIDDFDQNHQLPHHHTYTSYVNIILFKLSMLASCQLDRDLSLSFYLSSVRLTIWQFVGENCKNVIGSICNASFIHLICTWHAAPDNIRLILYFEC